MTWDTDGRVDVTCPYPLLLGAICLVLWCGSMWTQPLHGTDEKRYSAVAQELLGRGNWFYLTYQGEAYDEKPPLTFWMTAGLMRLTGQTDNVWLMRLPGFLAALATILLTYCIGRDLESPRVGFVAGLMLITARLVSKQAMVVRLDMIYTAWMTLALWLWLRGLRRSSRMSVGERVVFWSALAAAFFSRNALAPAILLVVIGLTCWRVGSTKPWRMLGPLPGMLALATFVLGWFYVQQQLYPASVLDNQLHEQILDRFGSDVRHGKPVWYYIISVMGEGFGPWGLILPFALAALGRSRMNPRLEPLAWLFAVFFVLLSVVGAKRPEYLLPAYPAMAVLTASYAIQYLARHPLSPAWQRGIGSATIITGILLFIGCVVVLWSPSWGAAVNLHLRRFQWMQVGVIIAAWLVTGIAMHRVSNRYGALYGSLFYLVLVYATFFYTVRA